MPEAAPEGLIMVPGHPALLGWAEAGQRTRQELRILVVVGADGINPAALG